MEEFLLGAGSAAILAGLAALVEAGRSRHARKGRRLFRSGQLLAKASFAIRVLHASLDPGARQPLDHTATGNFGDACPAVVVLRQAWVAEAGVMQDQMGQGLPDR
jgi:hypothetical protein